MHDRNGTELKVGDIVNLKLEIISISPGAEYCNVTALTVEGRKPDGAKDQIILNTAQLVLQEAS